MTADAFAGRPVPDAETRRCPICEKPVVAEFRPFCSRRCTDVDLHRWLVGHYAVPAAAQDEEDEAGPDRDAAAADEAG